jgi:hypothetical protein
VVGVKVRGMTNELINHLENQQRQGRNDASFKALDPGEIAKMSDKELAAWSTRQDADSPQRTLAMFEWQRRLNKQLVEGSLNGARLGGRSAIIGAVCGALLGALLTWFGSQYGSKQERGMEQNAYRRGTSNKDKEILPKAALSVDQTAQPKAGENKQ